MNLDSVVLQVHIEDIIPNRFQPRLAFDEQALKELSDSIKEHGIIQPLVLRKLGNKYEIIAGERRFKAAQMAGLTTVPAVIANIDDNKSAEVALVENVQRKDLTAIEEARSYKSLLDKGYLTQDELAKKMGLSQSAVANKLRLLNLDDEVQQALLDEKISERHARTLLTITNKDEQREWLHRVINERLTVRQLDIELKKLRDSGALELDENILNEKREILEEIEDTPQIVEEKTSSLKNDIFKGGRPDSKFFSFNDNSFNEPTNENQIEQLTEPKKELEIYDDEENIELETTKEELPSIENNFNNNEDFSSHNKFFTPVEKSELITIDTKEEEIDPMDRVDNLEMKEIPSEVIEELYLKNAIQKIRTCIKDLGNEGFYINVEEIPFENCYQITIRINK